MLVLRTVREVLEKRQNYWMLCTLHEKLCTLNITDKIGPS